MAAEPDSEPDPQVLSRVGDTHAELSIIFPS